MTDQGGTSSFEPPLVIEDAASVEWDDSADVVVVGFGGAGAAAALQAVEDGAEVLAIDRFGGGGATAYSGAVIYAGDTKYQREAGIEDSVEEMFKYLRAEGTPLSDEALRRFCAESAGNMEWLEEHGVPYGGNPYLGKTAFPPDGYWIYYSGNEKIPVFAEQAKPAPRGHRVVTPGFGGHLHYARLRESALFRGARMLMHAPAKRLIVDRQGVVSGIEVNALPASSWPEHEELYKIVNPWKPLNGPRSERAIAKARALEAKAGKPRRIRARGGVILATGGFTYNLDMLAQHRPKLAPNYEGLLRLGSMGDDGSGIELGRSAGGATSLMERLFLGSPLSPPAAYIEGVVVNTDGERFINEDAYHAKIGDALSEQPGQGKGWLILDKRSFWTALKQAAFPGKGMFMMWGAPVLFNLALGGTRRGRTLEKLARKCGIDPAGLRRTIEEYSAAARERKPDRYGKAPDKMHSIDQAPYYAVNLAIENRFWPTMMFTLGGLVVDEKSGEVLRDDRSPVAGLYAAGRTAVGVCSHEYMSGLSIADTVFSGRRAGRDAARRAAAVASDAAAEQAVVAR